MFSPPGRFVSGGVGGKGRERERETGEKVRTGNNDILRAILNLDAAVRMPHRQIPRVQDTSRKQLARRLRVLVVLLAADVAREHNLANLLAVLGHVDNYALGQVRLDDADRQAHDEAVALARHLGVLFVLGQRVPRGQDVAARDGPVGLGQAVDVHGEEVEIRHLLEEVGSRRAGGDGDTYRVGERLGLLGGAEEGVDCWCGVEVRDAFFLEELPD